MRKLCWYSAIFPTWIIDDIVCFAFTKWSYCVFNPSRAPNFGGMWEAAGKAAKYHLAMSACISLLFFERQIQLLYEVPRQGSEIFTQSHFLIGQGKVTLPEIDDECLSLHIRFKFV